jgi:prepilin-type N-terminal cleavage/methylation domain-containing protein
MARRGFTLIEVLAVVALTSVVLGVALNSYVNLSHASARATENTRSVRRATSLIDRVARDFESATLVTTPAEVDPLSQPWLFFAESRYASGGSDQIKFVTRNHLPRSPEAHESDLSMVAYSVRQSEEDDSLELLRWASPHLPESLDRDIPRDEGDGAELMAEGLASFSLRFRDDLGEWVDRWDSTTIDSANELPRAIEVKVGFWSEENSDPEDAETFERNILLPIRPIDLAVLLDPELALARSRAAREGVADEDNPDGDDEDGTGDDADNDGNGNDNDDEPTNNSCSDPSSPVQAYTVERCINRAIVGPRVNELKERYDQYLNDPFCRWASVIPAIIVHRTCK